MNADIPGIQRAVRALSLSLMAFATLASRQAAAIDVNWSGFGTIGYATSDRPYAYQRDITDDGTFKRDSLFALQADAQFSPAWFASVQGKLAQSLDNDARWTLTPSWAFLAWRPADDWLVRAGELRVPLYLYSESLDVGEATDMARLPIEMYSIAPTTNFTGAYVTRSWSGEGDRTFDLDAYTGSFRTTARLWYRFGEEPQFAPGAHFDDVKVDMTGLAFSFRQPTTLLRAGVHHAATSNGDGSPLPATYPYVQIAPGLGYYQINPSMPGPGLPEVSHYDNYVFTLGAEQQFSDGWRASFEVVRNIQHKTQVSEVSDGGYVAIFKKIDRYTPYASYGRLRSGQASLDWYKRLTSVQLPSYIPGAAQLNASQQIAADSLYAVDQGTFALGTSYAVTSASKLKIEWQRTHIGLTSRLVDSPVGLPAVNGTHIDVVSINYSFAF